MASVSNGQLANATTFNNAFMSRTSDTSTTGRIDLNNALTASGSTLANTQRALNALFALIGEANTVAKDADPTWTNNDVGASTDSHVTRGSALSALFNATTGHTHDGTTGNGPQVDKLLLTGSQASPEAIVAGTGIAFVGTKARQLWIVQGSGGAVDISANPQISTGAFEGQELLIQGTSNANTVKLDQGTGLTLNGSITLGANDMIYLIYNNSTWVEVSRNK